MNTIASAQADRLNATLLTMDVVDELRHRAAELKDLAEKGLDDAGLKRRLADIYRAALGMLGGTPLGEAARQRLSPPDPGQSPEEQLPEPGEPEAEMIGASDIEAARAAGRDAFQQGVKVIANPFVAGDPRRAAWDEGWCRAAGSDGMDIPEAWRRRKADKPKKPDESEA